MSARTERRLRTRTCGSRNRDHLPLRETRRGIVAATYVPQIFRSKTAYHEVEQARAVCARIPACTPEALERYHYQHEHQTNR
jgi:hypothetical protein